MLKYSDIYDLWEPITIVIFDESLQTLVYILPVGQCTPDTKYNVCKWRHASSVDIEPNNLCAPRYTPSMAFISKTVWTIYFKYFVMGTSWVALSIKNIKTRASREMTSRKISILMGWTLPSTGMWRARYWPFLIVLFIIVSLDILIHECRVLKQWRI